MDRHVIACNCSEASSVAAAGSLAYVVRLNPGGGEDRIPVLIRSRGGRWVEKWEDMRKLENFRAKTLPPEHPRYGDARLRDFDAGSLDRLRSAKERLSAAPV